MKPPGSRRGGWLGHLMLLLLPLLTWGQGPALAPLAQPVQLTPGRHSLGAVLAELSHQSHLPFSYSSSLVPLTRLCYLPAGPPRPAGVVLREVLAAEHLAYGVLNGQLVLWPEQLAPPAGITQVNGRPLPRPAATQGFGFSTAALASAPGKAPPAGRAGKSPVVAATGATGNSPLASSTSSRVPTSPAAQMAERGARNSAASNTRATILTYNGKQTRNISGKGGRPEEEFTRSKVKHSSIRGNAIATSKYSPARAKAISQPPAEALAQAGRGRPAGQRTAHQPTPAAALADRQRATKTGRTNARFSTSQSATTLAIVPPKNQPATKNFTRNPSRTAGLPRAAGQPREAVALLAPRGAEQVLAAGPTSGQPVLLPQLDSPVAVPKPLLSSVIKIDLAQQPTLRSPLERGFYLHGEAWGSETFPVGVAGRVGWARLHLVLGVAAAPSNHHGGWAFGGGLGTVGRARGRFTPSLDLLHWVATGDGRGDEAAQGQLTQLRPTLAWQLRQGSRWQLIGGPTFNLATAPHEGRGNPGGFIPRWTLGQDQWLWLDTADERSGARLWPGVQLGLRF